MVRSVNDWTVDPNAPEPPSRQLVEAALDAIAGGELTPGDRLPPVRKLAATVLVNANTVAKAYRDLEALGVAVGRNGSGVFVSEGAVPIARAARTAATLAAFTSAARAALRAGHTASDLADTIRRESRARNSA